MKKCEDILQIVEANKETIRGFGVTRLGLFGSYARGVATPGSDMDFVVEFKKKTFDGYMDLKFFLEDLFEHKIDLVLPEKIKRRVRKPILEETVYAQGL